MDKYEHHLKLLISNSSDRELLTSFLHDAGYLIDSSTSLLEVEWNKISAIIADEVCARKFSEELLLIKRNANPVFLPIIIFLPANIDSTHWLKLGLDEVMRLPLVKAEFKSRIHTLLSLRKYTEAQFHLIYENIDIGAYRMSATMKIIQANPAFLKIFRISSLGSVLDKDMSAINVKFDSERKKTFDRIDSRNKLTGYESKCIRPDGTELYLRENVVFFQSKDSHESYYAGTIEEITQQKIMQEKLIKSEEKFRQLVDLSPYGILLEVDGIIVFHNEAAKKLFGSVADDLIGTLFLDRVPDESKTILKNRLIFVKEQNISTDIIEDKLLDVKNNIIDVELLVCPFLHEGKPSTQIIINDITNRKNAENRLLYMAYHDQLTGAANRLKLEEELNKIILFAKRNDKNAAVIFIDIDHFKKVNDTFGHDVGDLLLKEVAKRFHSCLSVKDTVARLGGDEFVILLDNLSNPKKEATEVVNNIMSSIAKPFNISNITIHITLSIGISLYPDDGMTSYTLFKNSDIAMYAAKQSGRNISRFCTSELSNDVYEKGHLEIELRDALSKNELILYYQPKISFESGKVMGVEALIRWQHPTKGLLLPTKFIPIAEASGMIVPISIFILNQACKQIKKWEQQNSLVFSVAINLSMRHFQDANMVHDISNILTSYDIDPTTIEFEITESALMQDVDKTLLTLNCFKDMGISISIDDFGTGYSSLSYLRQLNFNCLKIDKSFVNEIFRRPNDNRIIVSIIDMAHSMGMKVVAEGVETLTQYEYLRKNHCDEMQGYLYCEPLPANELISFINNHVPTEILLSEI